MLPYLPSKTFIPLVRGVVARSRLMEVLTEGLSMQLILISAPAGYGKSTLAAMWLRALQEQKGATGAPVYHCAWFSVEESESQFELFFGYLIEAIRTTLPGALPRSHDFLAQPTPVAPALFAGVLAGECAELPETVLVLDDLHLVRTESVYQVLNTVIRHAPNLHMVVLARLDPLLEIPRLRARSQLLEIRVADLQFTREESEALLTSRLGPLDAETINVLHGRTEGWATGLQLAMLRLRKHPEPKEFVHALSEHGDRYVADYLLDEVLQALPADVQGFLTATAILPRLSASLCAAVAMESEQEARSHLAFLNRNNLFLIALDDAGQWYRYHHQFRQSLLVHGIHMGCDMTALHRRAGLWHAAHRMIDEALHHLVLAGEGEAAARLVEENLAEVFNAERYHDLHRWLDHLPEAIVSRRPLLLAARAIYLVTIGVYPGVPELVRAAEELIERGTGIDSAEVRDEALGICAVSAAGHAFSHLSFQERVVAGERALALLPSRHQMLRGVAHHEIANRLRNLGQHEAAIERLMLALEAAGPAEVVLQLRIRLSLAIGHYFGGSMLEAEQYASRVLEDAQVPNAVYTLCIAHYGMGVVQLQRFELERVRHFLVLACDPERPGMLSVKILAAYALLRLLVEQGEQSAMAEIDRMIVQTANATAGMGFESQFAALATYSRWASGEKVSARQWAFQDSFPSLNAEFEVAALVRARILLEEGSPAALAHAETTLRTHFSPPFATFPGFITLESRLLLAQIHWQRGDHVAALELMEALVRDGYPRGFRRLFADSAVDGISMLRALAAQGRCVKETESLLRLLTTDTPQSLVDAEARKPSYAPEPADLLDPLTARELEVLHLLNQSYTREEIAERMVVSPHTVRNHLSNIYAKLNVHSRIAALRSAQSLGLLPPA